MVDINRVKIRARITVGNLIIVTPYILSFNVNITRGQISTFSASVKVPYTDVTGNITGDSIVIEAGENTASDTVFSGMVKKATISPVFDDPNFVLINMSGEDILSKLVGKKYTRRCRSTATSWVTIDNVVRKGLRSGKFRAKKSDYITMVNTELTENSEETKTGVILQFNDSKGVPPEIAEQIDGFATIVSNTEGTP